MKGQPPQPNHMTRSSLDDILLRWRKQSAASGYNQERVKGTAFEKLCMVYLTHDPTQKTQYEPPVRYGDWARQQGLPEIDLGIDLVARNRGGAVTSPVIITWLPYQAPATATYSWLYPAFTLQTLANLLPSDETRSVNKSGPPSKCIHVSG